MDTKLPRQPFNTLAIALSGGGYRASSFHLGSLTYLSSVTWKGSSLLERVRVLSTVSGGTFTGLCYAAELAQNNTLAHCYKKLYTFMSQTDLIEEGLKKLEDFDHWNSTKARSLINAFALVYHEKLDNNTVSLLYDSNTHLKEIIFNATEFTYGLPFRLQRSELNEREYNYAFLGNRQVNMPPQAIREIHLADIVAASSCFPMGFEPINFPTDFRHQHSPVLNSLRESYKNDMWGNKCQFPIGLMDGGIVDNQGIDSVIQAEQLMKAYPKGKRQFISDDKKTIDLFIVNDVSSPFMKGYIRTEEKEMRFWRKLSFRKFAIFGWSAVVLAIGAATLVFFSKNQGITFLAGVLTAVFSIGGIASIFLSRLFHRVMKKFEIPEFFSRRLRHFTKMKFGIYETLISNRISSVISMVSEVFMKQIRRQQYGRLYADPTWKSRLVMNAIYELAPQQTVYRNSKRNSILSDELSEVSIKIMQAAETAKETGTTLWFTPEELAEQKESRLNTLIACGQFSMCFNLLEYIEKVLWHPENKDEYDLYPDETKAEINTLYTQMLSDWKAFKENPYWMIREFHRLHEIP